MTPEQEAARAAAESDTLTKKERALISYKDDVPTLDDYEDDRGFDALLDAEFDDLFEEYDDERDYS